MMAKRKYVKLSKPIEIRKFDEYKKPMGWERIERVLEDKKHLLTKPEINRLKEELE